jgi:hypothetical protein
MEDFERAKAYLQTASPTGKSLYDHLTTLVLTAVKDQPDDVVNLVEQLSVAIKNAELQPALRKELPANPAEDADRARMLASIDGTADLCRQLVTTANKPGT